MRTFPFKKIDAFASEKSAGNPAAVLYLESLDVLSDSEMLKIAKELQGYVSEVGFACPGTDTDIQLRYYSAEREVAFCGHATIAILNDIIANDPELGKKPILTIKTLNDTLSAINCFAEEKRVYISAPPPRFSSKTIPKEAIATALKCPPESLHLSRPASVLNAGLETLIVPMASLETILDVSPDLAPLKDFCARMAVDIITLYSDQTSTPGCRYRSRVFAPTFGYLEDPATGSGNSALGYYLLKNNMWNGDSITIEQNGSKDSPNFVQIQTDKDSGQLWFGGGAALKIDGNYTIS